MPAAITINPAALVPTGFGTYVAALSTIKPKRYVVGTELWFNAPLTVKGVTYPARFPTNKKLLLYNSYGDLMARRNAIPFDVSNGIKAPVQCFQTTLKALSVADNPAKYLADNRFNVKLFFNNRLFWYSYDPKDSIFLYSHTADAATAARLSQLAQLEAEIHKLAVQAQANAKLLAAMANAPAPSPAFTQKLKSEVLAFNALLESYKRDTPKELKVVIQKNTPASLNGIGFLPAIPAIVWWVAGAIAGAGVIAWTVADINREKQRTIRTKQALAQQYSNLQLLAQNPNNQALKDAVQKANQSNAEVLNNSTENTPTIFGEAKNLLLWGGAVVLAVKILPNLFKPQE